MKRKSSRRLKVTVDYDYVTVAVKQLREAPVRIAIHKMESPVNYANLGYRYVYVTRRVVCMDKWGDGWMDEKRIGVVLS